MSEQQSQEPLTRRELRARQAAAVAPAPAQLATAEVDAANEAGAVAEAGAVVDEAGSTQTVTSDAATRPSRSSAADRARGDEPTTSARAEEFVDRPPQRPWRRWALDGRITPGWGLAQVVWALVAYAVAIAAGLAISALLGGSLGRSAGLGLAATVLALPVFVQLLVSRPKALFRVRFWDVVVGVFLGLLAPFLAGAAGGLLGASTSWPAFESFGLRWFALGILLPLYAALVLPFFFDVLVLVGLFAWLRALGLPSWLTHWVPPVIATMLAGALAVVFAGGVAATPTLLSILVAALGAGFVMLSGRFWAALIISVTAAGTWAALSLAGYVLA